MVWYRPSATHLKIFWSIAYAHIPMEKRRKLDDKSKKCIFIGYSNETKGYRLYDSMIGKLEISRDMIFDEGSAWDWTVDDVSKPLKLQEKKVINVLNVSGNRILEREVHTESNDGGVQSSNNGEQFEHSSRKFRSLSDIYESRQLVYFTAEPVNYEEASKQEV